MQTKKYLIPIVPVSKNCIHKNFFEYFRYSLFSPHFHNYHKKNVFNFPDRKIKISIYSTQDEKNLEVIIESKRRWFGKWEKQLVKIIEEFKGEEIEVLTQNSSNH